MIIPSLFGLSHERNEFKESESDLRKVTQNLFGLGSTCEQTSNLDMIELIKALDVEILSREEDIQIVTGKVRDDITGDIVIAIDANIKCQAISAKELYILGDSRIQSDVISSKIFVAWCRTLTSDYITAKHGFIATDSLSVSKMKTSIEVYQEINGRLPYNWKEMTRAVKELLETLKLNFNDAEEIESFTASNYGGSTSIRRTVNLNSDDDEDEMADLKLEVNDELTPLFEVVDKDPKHKKMFLGLVKTIQHEDLQNILKDLIENPQNREEAIENLIELMSDEEEYNTALEALHEFQESVNEYMEENREQVKSDSAVHISKEEWAKIEKLPNSVLKKILLSLCDEDILGDSKKTLIAQIRLMERLDPRIRTAIRAALEEDESAEATDEWEKAKADNSTIHSETIAAEEARAQQEAQQEAVETNEKESQTA